MREGNLVTLQDWGLILATTEVKEGRMVKAEAQRAVAKCTYSTDLVEEGLSRRERGGGRQNRRQSPKEKLGKESARTFRANSVVENSGRRTYVTRNDARTNAGEKGC